MSREALAEYWKTFPDYADPKHICFAGSYTRVHSPEDYAYDSRVIGMDEVEMYLAAIRNDKSERKLPTDAENFEKTAIKSLCYCLGEPMLQNASRWCPEYYQLLDRVNEAIRRMRTGETAEETGEKIIRGIYWWYSGDVEGKEENIPQIFYYGYNRKEIEEKGISSLFIRGRDSAGCAV